MEYVRRAVDRIDDVLLRQLVWMSMWEMVRDCRLRSTDFVDICRTRLGAEPDHDIVSSSLERMALALARYVPESRREAEAHAVFEAAMANLRAADDSDGHIIWARSAISSAASAADVARLLALLDGEDEIDGFTLDQEMRWGIVTKAVAYGLPDGEGRLAVETARDPSDRGRRALIRADASRPELEAKENAWRKIHGDGYGSFHFTRAAMTGFFWPHQADLVEPFVPRFFDEVRRVFETRDHPFARSYLTLMYPAYRGDPAVLERSRRLESSLDGTLPTLSRQLAESADELERAIRIRAYAES
jgi:aminopeptidase N